MSSRQPLSYADYALFRFDTPENWMIITALLTFEGRLELGELSAIVERFMLPQRRFRQRLAPPRLPGSVLYSGFYLNELLMRLLQRNDPHPELFAAYGQALHGLQTEPQRPLRLFEKHLLEALGYGLLLDHDAGSGEHAPVETGGRDRARHDRRNRLGVD